MQFDEQRVFPYPVLRPDINDYTDGAFQATVDLSADDDDLKVELLYQLSVQEIAGRIKDQEAAFTTVFSCRDTYRREVHKTLSHEDSFSFPHGIFRGEVAISSYIVATKHIQGFKCPLINEEFGDGPFEFPNGSVIAVDEPKLIYLERENFRPISSVFELVQKDTVADWEWHIDFDHSRVRIVVSPVAKKKIDIARNEKSKQVILLNSLYFSAVTQALKVLREDDTYHEYKWAQVFFKQIQNHGMDLDTIEDYKAAQTLMHEPMRLMQQYHFQGDEE